MSDVAFPDRAADALSGSALTADIMDLPLGPERGERIKAELLAGNVPSWARHGLEVTVSYGGHSGILFVLPDYLAIGSDDDYVRVPMNPLTAQAVADSVDCILPTRSMVNSIWAAAHTRLTYKNLPPTPAMTSTKWFVDHNAFIQTQLSAGHMPTDGIIAGHKKDVVLCKAFENALPFPKGHGDRVAIYGWCKTIHYDDSWEVIQDLNPSSHDNEYADYSHGIRLICAQMLVDQEYKSVSEVLADADLSGLVSDEGPVSVSRYPGT